MDHPKTDKRIETKMDHPKLINIWLETRPKKSKSGQVFIRLDWDNDRHHAIRVHPPYDKKELVKALYNALVLIKHDPNLE